MRSLTTIVFPVFGTCSKCTRKAFVASAAAWSAFVPTVTLVQQPVVIEACAIGASILTALWISHALAFSYRMSTAKRRSAAKSIEHGRPTARRVFLREFCRTVIAVTAFSALGFASPAMAECWDEGMQCDSQHPCCPGLNCVRVGSGGSLCEKPGF